MKAMLPVVKVPRGGNGRAKQEAGCVCRLLPSWWLRCLHSLGLFRVGKKLLTLAGASAAVSSAGVMESEGECVNFSIGLFQEAGRIWGGNCATAPSGSSHRTFCILFVFFSYFERKKSHSAELRVVWLYWHWIKRKRENAQTKIENLFRELENPAL